MSSFNSIKVLGCDPSLNNFGLVKASVDMDTLEVSIESMFLACPPKIDAATKKAVRKNSDDLRRARFQQKAFAEYCKGSAITIVEVPVGSQSARAMASYGICVGVLASSPIPMIEVNPTEVKLTAVGTKTASKADMIEWAMAKHPEAEWILRKSKGVMVPTNANEHLADAIAAIYAGIATEQFKAATSMMRSMNAA